MTEVASHPKPVVKNAPAHQPGIRPARLVSVVDRTSELSNEVLKSLETGERSAIEALGKFVITVEDALPQEVAGTSEVAKKITESGLEMIDRLVHTEYDFLRNVLDSAAKSVSSRN
jgi:hypothetical protein